MFFVLVVVETVVSWFRLRTELSPRLIVSTAVMALVEQGIRIATYGLRFALFSLLAGLSPWQLETNVATVVGGYLAVDLIYYWRHRLLHATQLGWALHNAHHSSTEFNLLAAIRLGWGERLVDDLFYCPLPLLGVDPLVALLLVELNHAQPFWCHTRTIGRLRWLDPWLNTPSNHRVHHAAQRSLADANYGSTLMIWDRLFGTYRPEPASAELEYGSPEVGATLNPLQIQLLPLVRYVRRLAGAEQPGGAEQQRPDHPNPDQRAREQGRHQ